MQLDPEEYSERQETTHLLTFDAWVILSGLSLSLNGFYGPHISMNSACVSCVAVVHNIVCSCIFLLNRPIVLLDVLLMPVILRGQFYVYEAGDGSTGPLDFVEAFPDGIRCSTHRHGSPRAIGDSFASIDQWFCQTFKEWVTGIAGKRLKNNEKHQHFTNSEHDLHCFCQTVLKFSPANLNDDTDDKDDKDIQRSQRRQRQGNGMQYYAMLRSEHWTRFFFL